MGSVNPYAFKAHGLSEEFLSHHQSIEIVLANFMRWVGSAPLVAHNSRFDMRMLCQELRRWDLPLNDNKVSNPWSPVPPTRVSSLKEWVCACVWWATQIFCTLRYYRAKYPGMPYSLDDLANRFHIDQIIERYVYPVRPHAPHSTHDIIMHSTIAHSRNTDERTARSLTPRYAPAPTRTSSTPSDSAPTSTSRKTKIETETETETENETKGKGK
jgi:hypothetical protein